MQEVYLHIFSFVIILSTFSINGCLSHSVALSYYWCLLLGIYMFFLLCFVDEFYV